MSSLTCPTCGGSKSASARQCQNCKRLDQIGVPGPRGGMYTDDAVHTIGRRESIVTFRDLDTGALATRHCVGNNIAGQVADGQRQLAGQGSGTWVVECRSTPASILNDLRGRQVQRRHGPARQW